MNQPAQRLRRGEVIPGARKSTVFSGIFTRLAASIGSTRTRWDSSASEGSTVAGSSANVISVKSVNRFPFPEYG